MRPTRDAAERRRWDALMAEHHYLPYRTLFGRALRHVAEYDGEWLALVGWQVGAFKLGARDRWIGWLPAQQFRRLHLIANNARFLILPQARVANLASRVLGLSLRRLSADWRVLHGCPALLAESFVDPARFTGACYRAANWRSVGFTRGYARRPGASPRWEHHGQPKEVFMYELKKGAAAALRALEDEADWSERGAVQAPDLPGLLSLYQHFRQIPDYRSAHGRRYSLAMVLAIAVAARLCGHRGVVAFGEFAQALGQDTLAALHSHYNRRLRRYTAPVGTTFHTILSQLPGDALEQALRSWMQAQNPPGEAVAMDGKVVRGAARQRPDGTGATLVAAIRHGSGVVLGQEAVSEGGSEIPAVRTLAEALELRGQVVTVDALHTQGETAEVLVRQGADYVMAVKGNQPGLLDDLRQWDWDHPKTRASERRTQDKGHGRFEQRACRTVDLRGPEWDGFVGLPHRAQGARLVRQRHDYRTGEDATETVYVLTSLSPQQADAERLMALVRGHWEIENRLHYARDWSFDEDRCRVSVGELPRNLASLSNAAISLIRLQGCFDYLPQAQRYYAGHRHEALRAVTQTPLPI